MEMISEIIEEGMKEKDEEKDPRCPSCRNTLSDLENIDMIAGTNGMMTTIECSQCKSHIILSQELIENIRRVMNNDKETVSGIKRNPKEVK